MNSLFNEQPARIITDDFIEKAVSEASTAYAVTLVTTSLWFGQFQIFKTFHDHYTVKDPWIVSQVDILKACSIVHMNPKTL